MVQDGKTQPSIFMKTEGNHSSPLQSPLHTKNLDIQHKTTKIEVIPEEFKEESESEVNRSKMVDFKNFKKDKFLKIENDLKIEESRNFTLKKMIFVLANIALSLILTFLRGGKGMESIIGMKKCSGLEWQIFSVYFILVGVLAFYGSYSVLKTQKIKERIKWKFHACEKKFTSKFILKCNFYGFAIGIISANVGIGGGLVITPLLLSYDYLPVVVSYTGMYMVVVNKIVSTTVFLLSGNMPIDYMLVIGSCLICGVAITELKLGQYIKKVGRPSIITFIFVGVVFTALCLVLYSGYEKIWGSESTPEVWKFKNFCDA